MISIGQKKSRWPVKTSCNSLQLTCCRLPTKNDLVDWDSADSINIADMEKALTHIRSEGTFPVSQNPMEFLSMRRSSHAKLASPLIRIPIRSTPCLPMTYSPVQPFVDSKEDKNSVGSCPASDDQISVMKAKVQAWLQPGRPGHDIFSDGNPLRMCLLDGFLLYSPPDFNKIMDLIDIKLFLQVSRAKATQRREARDGYVTLEGFWKDPPGYVDKIVWPNYVEAHQWMFEHGDVEGGKLKWELLQEKHILAQQSSMSDPQTDFAFEETLEWAVEQVMMALQGWHARKVEES